MLVEPPIAIVGLSNWVLDPAKMNRAVLVQRPEPSDHDISHTGSSIMGLPEGTASCPIVDLLQKISRAYFEVYTHQKDRDFIGMRDYYSLIKSLRAELPKNMKRLLETTLSKDKAIFAICRNFSGRDDILKDVLYVMCKELYGVKGKKKLKKMEEMSIGEVERSFGFQRPLLPDLIRSNLESCTVSRESRHLMLLTNNCAALPLIFSCGLVGRSKTKVIIGSEFVEDNTELFLVQQMNEVKLAMAKGKAIVLMNADNMYEALYDVLNQRYLEKTDQKTGKKTRLLRLAIGSRSSLCQVAPGFRIIVIVEKEYAYRTLDLPLLNRFEKQILTPINALQRRSLKIANELSSWVENILNETSLPSTQHIFCGFHPGTIPSLVFRLTQEKNCSIDEAKRCLKKIATPSALTLSNSLQNIEGASPHSTLAKYLEEMFDFSSKKPISSVVMTCSPVTHLEGEILDSLKDIADVTRCRLDQVKSEKAFSLVVQRHLNPQQSTSKKRLLLVQFDPIMCSSLQINHAKFLVTNEISSWSRKSDEVVAVLFLVHMPPGIKARSRTFVLDFRVNWDYLFLDDIRGFILTKQLSQKISLPSLLQAPIKELFDLGLVALKEVISSQISAAISRMRLPIPPAPYPLPFLSDSMDVPTVQEKFLCSNRIHALKGLLQIPAFETFFYGSIHSLLEHYGNERDPERGNLFLHTSLAIGDFSCGTLLQSLERTVAELTLQAMIALLILFEKNFTLGTLAGNPELWMELVNNKNAVDVSTVRVGFGLGGREVMRQLQSRLPLNTGKIQILVSQFPFSYSVFALLNGGQTREAIEAALGGKFKDGVKRFELEAEFLEKTFASFFGDNVVELVRAKSEREGGSLSYFHDFVGMIAPPVDKLMLEEVQFVYQAILQSFHPHSLRSPATIHAAFWQNENQIQIVCSILSILSPSDRLRVLSAMHEACNLPNHSHRFVCVLEAVFDAVFRIVWVKASQLTFVQQPLGIPCSHESTTQLATLIATVGENMVDLLSAWETSIKSLPSLMPPVSPIQRWASVTSLKILLEGYDRLQWGMGERAQNLMSLLQEPAANPCSFKFFESFFSGLALFYAPIRCCVQCSAVLHHTEDHRNFVATSLCPSCERVEEEKAKGAITKGDANELGEEFWDSFLISPGEREARVLRTATAKNSSKKRKRNEDEGSGTKKRKEGNGSLKEFNEQQIQQISTRFLERGFVRYVGEVLFPDGLSIERLNKVDTKLIAHINQYANSEESLTKSKNREIDPLVDCPPCPATCLALMHILLRAESQANIEEGEVDQDCLFKITSSAGKMVYLSYWLSKFGESVDKLGLDSSSSLTQICQFIPEDELEIVLKWLNSPQPDPKWGFLRREIRALARVQVALRWYGRCLASDDFPSEEHLSNPSALKAFHKFFNNILVDRTPAQQYVLKTVKEAAGINGVLAFLLSDDKKGAMWVDCDDSQLSVVIEDCPIGPLLCENEFRAQFEFREKIQAVLTNPKNSSAFQALVGDSGLIPFFIPALYHEITHRAVMEKNPADLISKVIQISECVKHHLTETKFADQAKLLPLVTQIILILSFGPTHNCIDTSLLPCPHDGKTELTTKGKILCQIMLRILNGSFQKPTSWLAEFITSPQVWAQRYIPGSKFDQPLSNVQWYECPNGHPYSIGECGKPMQTSKCSECGVEIGGRDHSNVAGVRQIQNVTLDFVSHLGYQLLPFERVGRLESSAPFFRLLIDLSLFLSMFVSSPDAVARLVHQREVGNLRSHFLKAIGQHLEELRKNNRLDPMLIGVSMNAVFCKFFSPKSVLWNTGKDFIQKSVVHNTENPIKHAMRKIITDIKASIQHRLGTSFQAAQREKVLKKALGERGWNALLEALTNPSEAEILFRFSPSATIEDFFRATDSTNAFKERYPLLSAFVNEEKRLQLVKYIIPVLEWHRLLFSVFQSNEIDHEEAGKITNEEAVQRLPTELERKKGRELLEGYCKAFNESFHLVGELLFECQENIFLREGEVSLFGEKMSPSTPIAFSLPSISEGQATRDPMGLCTVGLLTALHRAHEECLRLGEGNDEAEGNNHQQQDGAEAVGLPEISCSSFSRVLRQKLIIYDRQAHLLPLLNTRSSPDEKGGLKYDLSAIEDGLRLGILHGKQSLRLHIKYYQFRGDVRTSNRLATLRKRVPQSDVSKQTMQLILHEVDIESRMIRLLSNLEMVINFVARIGGEEAKEIGIGRKLVKQYAIETLQMDAGDWEEGTTPTVNEQIRLCHLSFLFMRLQEEAGGNPLDDLPADYREALDENQKSEFQKPLESESKEFSYLLLPKLKNFLVDKVASKEPAWERDPELMLKDLLQYEFTSDKDWDWFDTHFPDVLKLKHAFGLYQWLMEWKG